MSTIAFNKEPVGGQDLVRAALVQAYQDPSLCPLLPTSGVGSLSIVSPAPVYILLLDQNGELHEKNIQFNGGHYQVMSGKTAVAQAYVDTAVNDRGTAVAHRMLQFGPLAQGFSAAVRNAGAKLTSADVDVSPALLIFPELACHALWLKPSSGPDRFFPVDPAPQGLSADLYSLEDLLSALTPIAQAAIRSGKIF